MAKWGCIARVIDYDPHKWRDHLWDIRGSMLREIVYRVLASVLAAVAVVATHRYGRDVSIAAIPHTLVGVALGLLLVFRTNASYDRFWEGRRQWGAIVNESRNLVRAAKPWLATAPALYRRLVRWTAAFPFATMHQLRNQSSVGEASRFLTAEEAATIRGRPHVPLAIADEMTRTLADARATAALPEIAHVAMDGLITQLVDYLGACERIHRTPLPFAYVVHLRRALLIYTFTLPFALVATFGWWTVLATLGLSYIYFGIEEIGVEIEDPFGSDDNDLPLERICRNIERDVSHLAGLEAEWLPTSEDRAQAPAT